MKTASISELRKDLKHCSQEELLDICLTLTKYKKENKELLTYLLYESSDEDGFVRGVKDETEFLFSEINRSSYYFIKKSVRKILRNIKKYIRYSKQKESEVALLLHFCKQLKGMSPNIRHNKELMNLLERQVKSIDKAIDSLHEDLQYDFRKELENL